MKELASVFAKETSGLHEHDLPSFREFQLSSAVPDYLDCFCVAGVVLFGT